MKTVTERPSFQGEMMIRKVASLPKGMKVVAPTDGIHILAHSETGHHHVIDSRNAQKLIDDTNALIAALDVKQDTVLRHLRDFDTHEPLLLTTGIYEIRLAREMSPEGWRRAAD